MSRRPRKDNVTEYTQSDLQALYHFMDPVIHTELSWDRVIQLTLLVFGATLGSGIYPALKAGRVTPVEALRT